MHNSERLLDDLASKLGCDYLSELTRKQYAHILAAALRCVVPECYSLGQWNEAACYLTRVRTQYTSAEEARTALVRALGGRWWSK